MCTDMLMNWYIRLIKKVIICCVSLFFFFLKKKKEKINKWLYILAQLVISEPDY
jgi:hypothetical protein